MRWCWMFASTLGFGHPSCWRLTHLGDWWEVESGWDKLADRIKSKSILESKKGCSELPCLKSQERNVEKVNPMIPCFFQIPLSDSSLITTNLWELFCDWFSPGESSWARRAALCSTFACLPLRRHMHRRLRVDWWEKPAPKFWKTRQLSVFGPSSFMDIYGGFHIPANTLHFKY